MEKSNLSLKEQRVLAINSLVKAYIKKYSEKMMYPSGGKNVGEKRELLAFGYDNSQTVHVEMKDNDKFAYLYNELIKSTVTYSVSIDKRGGYSRYGYFISIDFYNFMDSKINGKTKFKKLVVLQKNKEDENPCLSYTFKR